VVTRSLANWHGGDAVHTRQAKFLPMRFDMRDVEGIVDERESTIR